MNWVACDLGKVKDPNNQARLGAALVDAMTGYTELGDGYRFSLPADALVQVSEWMAGERACCGFFKFEVSLEPGAEELHLTLAGGEGVKQFIASTVVPAVGLEEGSDQQGNSGH